MQQRLFLRDTLHGAQRDPTHAGTSVFRWPAFSKTSTSCRLSIPHILPSSTPAPRLEYKDTFYRLWGFLGVPEFSELVRRAKIYGTDNCARRGWMTVSRKSLKRFGER